MRAFFAQPLVRRLWPLYAAAFSHGFILWYATEKFFMHGIGFTDTTIGIMAAVYTITVLTVETPSGILADRWSRKGVLMIASSLLLISTVIGGLSYGVPVYILAMALWGIFFAMYSGTYESIVYDVLLEEQGTAKSYEKWYGYVRVVDSVALASGALLGGLVASISSPRATYLATIPFTVIAITALLKFKEPILHKAEPLAPVATHVRQTFAAILQRRTLLPLLVVLVSSGLLMQTILEFNQLWWLALATPVGLYGLGTAANLGALGLGGVVAQHVRLHTVGHLVPVCMLLVVSVSALIWWRNFYAVVVAQVMLVSITMICQIIFSKALHDVLPSRLRAGAASAVSTFVSVLFIPVALLFGPISEQKDTFSAAWLCAVVVVVLGVTLISRPSNVLARSSIADAPEMPHR